jgi:APA family basic amino acid/polyamine antiporter
MKHFKHLNLWKRFGIPMLAIMGSLIIVYGGIIKPSIGIYLLISIGVIFFGLLFYRKEK